MNFRNSSLVLCASALSLSACIDLGPRIEGGQYWQRVSASEAIYQQGPKVQQMLDRDIGRCVVEMRELERLGAIKNGIPTDSSGRVLDPDEKQLSKTDIPDHNGSLLVEHTDYHDFEGCMLAKGWERVKYVPYDVAESARSNFYKANVHYGFDPAVATQDNSTESKAYRKLND